MNILNQIIFGIMMGVAIVYMMEYAFINRVISNAFAENPVELTANDQRGIYEFNLEQCDFVMNPYYQTYLRCVVE